MKIYLSIVSLFLMLLGTAYADSPEVERTTTVTTGPNFSFETGELSIPTVIVDGDALYDVKMKLINTESGMTFSLVEAVSLAPFEDRFSAIENNMSKSEVKNLLGIPQNMNFNLEIKAGAFCSEPQLSLGIATLFRTQRFIIRL